MSDPAAGQGKIRSASARTPQPGQQPAKKAAQKSVLGLTAMTAKPGRPTQVPGRAVVPQPGRGGDNRGQGERDQGERDQRGRDQGGRDRGARGQDNRGQDNRRQAARDKAVRDQISRAQASGAQTSHGQPGSTQPGQPQSGYAQSKTSDTRRPASGLTSWIRRRRTRAHLSYLPKWTARRAEPFDIGGLHWLPGSNADNRGPAIALHGGQSMLLAVAEMSPTTLRGPESADLGARLAAVLTAFAQPEQSDPSAGAAVGPNSSGLSAARPYRPALSRIQLLHQVPGSAGRTRSYLVLGFAHSAELVDRAARLGQGERGLTLLVSRAAENVFAMLGDPGPRGGRLGTLVPLDRAGWTRLLGSLVLPGRGDLVTPQAVAPPWRPTEIDALAPRFIAVTAPIGTAGQSSTWWHATSWVKRWPRGVGGLDLAACAGFLPPGVSGTASVILGLRPGADRSAMPTVAGYLTVSGHDAVEVELARVAAHAAADAREGFIEFCDRSHHVAFAHTLPLAYGLAD